MTTTASPSPSTSSPRGAPGKSWQQGPWPEIIGYVGAALVVGAGFALIAQAWDNWPIAAQFSLVLTGTMALYIAAVVLTVTAGGHSALAEHTTRRRLVGVLAGLAAPLLAATTALLLDWMGIVVDTPGSTLPLGLVGVAVAAGILAAWWAPGVIPTLVVGAACFTWLQVFLGLVAAPLEMPILDAAVGAVATIAWILVAPRFLPPRELTQALGVFAFISLQMSTAFMAFDMPPLLSDVAQTRLLWAIWFSRVALLAFAAVCLYVFARERSWLWAVGGVVAAGAGALSIAGQTLGLIAGLLVAGVILLAVSGALLLTRRRSEPPTSAPER